jgi:hypothetical protein
MANTYCKGNHFGARYQAVSNSKNMVVSPVGLGTRNNCAGENQQQFSSQSDSARLWILSYMDHWVPRIAGIAQSAQWLCHMLDDRDIWVLWRDYSVLYSVQIGFWIHPATNPVGAGDTLPGGKVAEAWSWPFSSCDCSELCLSSLMSHHGVMLH